MCGYITNTYLIIHSLCICFFHCYLLVQFHWQLLSIAIACGEPRTLSPNESHRSCISYLVKWNYTVLASRICYFDRDRSQSLYIMIYSQVTLLDLNTLRITKTRRYFADDIFKWILLIENVEISLQILPKFVPNFRINNIPAMVQIMAGR